MYFLIGWAIVGWIPILIGEVVAGLLCALLILGLIQAWKREMKDTVDLLAEGEPALCRIDDIKTITPLLIGFEYIYSIRYTAFIRSGSGFDLVPGSLRNPQLIAAANIHHVGDIRLIVYDPLNESRQVFDVFNVRMEDRKRLIEQLPFVSVTQR